MNTDPADKRAELVFYRRWAWRGTLRRYVIIVDGKRRGLLGHGRTLRVPVAAGQHTLEAKLDWMGSQPLEMSLEPSEEMRILVSVARGLLTPKLITNAPLLVLRPDPPPSR